MLKLIRNSGHDKHDNHTLPTYCIAQEQFKACFLKKEVKGRKGGKERGKCFNVLLDFQGLNDILLFT
jgi:hypothetical protein